MALGRLGAAFGRLGVNARATGSGWSTFNIPLFPVTSQHDNLSAMAYDASLFLGFVNQGTPQPAYTYTAAGGFNSLPLLNTGTFANIAACSSTGAVAVGYADPGNTSGFQHAARWATGAVTDLTPAIVNPGFSQAVWCSADGSFVVGFQSLTGAIFRAFSWTAGGGVVLLPILAGGSNNGAQFCSENSNVVAGYSDKTGGSYSACYWTGGGAAVEIPAPVSTSFSACTAGSSDGSVLVGTFTRSSDNQNRGFTWTSASGMVDIGDCPGARTNVQVRACSGSGSVLIGIADVAAGGNTSPVAFVWSPASGFTIIGGPKADGVCISKDGRTAAGDNFVNGVIWRKT